MLPILRELLRTRSVGKTAAIVGLSQSAVSAALARLRETYSDDLLVMVGRRLELTEKGASLVEPTERACLEIEALLRPPDFDPSCEARRFIVATADYVGFLLAPILAGRLARQAPLASVHFIDVPVDLNAQLLRGTVDMLVVPHYAAAPNRQMSSIPLFDDELVVIASRKHRSFEGVLTKEIYEQSVHARYGLLDSKSATHQDVSLRTLGVSQQDLILVQQFISLPAIVEASSCLALVQRRIAERFQPSHDIEILPPPFEIPPIHVTAYWSQSVQRDPAHRWFRGLMMQAGASLSELDPFEASAST